MSETTHPIDSESADSDDTAGPADADLILRARSGDNDAFGELWRRHYRSGIIVARSITSNLDPDDLVQEAYARIYQAIRAGGGPTGSFRAYLFTSIRNTAAGWGRALRETAIDELEAVADPSTTEQATSDALDRSLTHRAFRSLPTRWQEVLWYSEIEQMKPAEIAPLLGLNSAAVAQLAFRAREGLREAWIQAHVSTVAEGSDCQWIIGRLGAYARGNLSKRDTRKIEEHLDGCTRCSIVAAEARHVSDRLALVLLPLVLGVSGAGAYLSALQDGGTAVVAVAAMPSTVMAGAASVGNSTAAAGGTAATTGIFSGMGAVAGLAAAAIVVAGAVVTATVVIPAVSTSDSASGIALPSASAGNAGAAVDSRAEDTTTDESTPDVATPPDPAASVPSAEGSPTQPAVPAEPTTPTITPDQVVPPEPTNPPEPTLPPERTLPPEPTDPTEPVEPTEPADPTDPVDPGEPTDPTNPTNPTNPTEPADPDDPDDPVEPVLPEGSPEIASVSISFDGARITLALTLTAAPGTTIETLFGDASRGTVQVDDTGSAIVVLRPTAIELLRNPVVGLRYLAGEGTGPTTGIRLLALLT